MSEFLKNGFNFLRSLILGDSVSVSSAERIKALSHPVISPLEICAQSFKRVDVAAILQRAVLISAGMERVLKNTWEPKNKFSEVFAICVGVKIVIKLCWPWARVKSFSSPKSIKHKIKLLIIVIIKYIVRSRK